MNKSLIAVALLVAALMAASSAAGAQGDRHGASWRSAGNGGADAAVTFVNAPGGDYIQCDPRNPSSPVRCKPDGW